ncbi:MAG: IS110 family transposase [Rhodopila sp.]|jgi:transposase
MEAIVECCADLDVHQATVVACLNSGPPTRRSRREVRTFGTTRHELGKLRDWLLASGCTLVAMESTGIYWRPVHAELEDHFELIVGNAQHIKNVPGRKTDVKDCEWISDLARHGLIARSFVPPRRIRDLRDLTRYRCKLSQAQAAERNRLIKLLESANIKLSGVVSDVFGVSGQVMLRALIEGEESPAEMAQHARGRMRRKRPDLELALDGNVNEHHRFLLRMQLERIKATAAHLEQLDERLREKLAPHAEVLGRLMQIPGVNWVIAATIIAEIGVDMSAFVSADRLASWTGLCPGNHKSAGEHRSGKTRKGNVYLKTALVTAAVAAAKTRGTYLADKHRRLLARRGKLRAAVAIAHKILVAAYHIMATGSGYQEPGPTYLDRIDQRRTAGQLTRRLRALGYDVEITPKAA